MIVIHMVASLDGYVASQDNSYDWLEIQDSYANGKHLEEDDINDFLESIDCYVMGSKTYELALKLGWPYGEKPVFVATQRKRNADRSTVQFRADKLPSLAKELKSSYNNIWLVGGPSLVKEFLNQHLADKIIVTIKPILLGTGLPFFKDIQKEHRLHLEDVVAYQNGMVELSYTFQSDSK